MFKVKLSGEQKGVAAILSLFGAWVMFVITMNVVGAWILASAFTSGIKAATDDCGQRYPVEVVLGGDWFCPEKKE